MSSHEIVSLVIELLYAILALLTCHFVVFSVIGFFKHKKFPETEEKLKYGAIIPARNEEAVIGNLIESIQNAEYPQDKLHIFVIAHNCTDKTAEVARKYGVTVYEYNNPDECTMGYAFRYLFEQIKKDYGIETFDGYFLFNADNVVDQKYFSKMNDAFVACGRKNVITSYRNSKNFGYNLMTSLYGIYFLYGCCFESRGRTVAGVSTRVQGTGYVVSSDMVKDGWKYVTLTEDWEFTADQLLRDTPIIYCDEAIFYDEQPTGFQVMWRQRVRWARGHLLVCLSRLKDLISGFWKGAERGGTKRKFSTYDITVNILPMCTLTTLLFVVQVVNTVACGIANRNLLSELAAYGHWILISSVFSYVLLVLSAVLLYLREGKRIPKMRFGLKVLSVLVWPAFLFLSFPAEIVALFKHKLGWMPIPHTDTTKIETIAAGKNEPKEIKATKEKKVPVVETPTELSRPDELSA